MLIRVGNTYRTWRKGARRWRSLIIHSYHQGTLRAPGAPRERWSTLCCSSSSLQSSAVLSLGLLSPPLPLFFAQLFECSAAAFKELLYRLLDVSHCPLQGRLRKMGQRRGIFEGRCVTIIADFIAVEIKQFHFITSDLVRLTCRLRCPITAEAELFWRQRFSYTSDKHFQRCFGRKFEQRTSVRALGLFVDWLTERRWRNFETHEKRRLFNSFKKIQPNPPLPSATQNDPPPPFLLPILLCFQSMHIQFTSCIYWAPAILSWVILFLTLKKKNSFSL